MISDSALTKLPEGFYDLFEPELIQELESLFPAKKFPQGEVLMEPGSRIRFVPLILEGSVKVTRTEADGKEILLYFVGPNSSCAMTFTCCMEDRISEIKAVVEEDILLLQVPFGRMDAWMQQYPSWKGFVMKTIRERFDELLRTIDQIAFHKLDERLLKYLQDHIQNNGSSLINLSHQQMADDLATSRVVISRLLKKLEQDGKVLLFRNQVKVLNEGKKDK